MTQIKGTRDFVIRYVGNINFWNHESAFRFYELDINNNYRKISQSCLSIEFF